MTITFGTLILLGIGVGIIITEILFIRMLLENRNG